MLGGTRRRSPVPDEPFASGRLRVVAGRIEALPDEATRGRPSFASLRLAAGMPLKTRSVRSGEGTKPTHAAIETARFVADRGMAG